MNNPTSLHPVCEKQRWGFVNSAGTLAIPKRFSLAEPFVDGLALVEVGGAASYQGVPGFVDPHGDFRIGPGPPQHIHLNDWRELHEATGVRGWNYRGFSEGLAAFTIAPGGHDQRVGFIDSDGGIAIEPRFWMVGNFVDGVTWVRLHRDGGHYALLDNEGREHRLEQAVDYVADFCCGLAVVRVNGKYGFIDTHGNVVVSPAYNYAESFTEGLGRVLSTNGRWGFVNVEGELVIERKYDTAQSFSEGVAFVVSTGQGAMIDTAGLICAAVEDDCTLVFAHEPSSEGHFQVRRDDSAGNSKFGYFDSKGELAIPFVLDESTPFMDGLSWVVVGDKTGYMNYRGEFVWSTRSWFAPA